MKAQGRRTVRLNGHDYGAGTYFVTICTAGRLCLFGEVVDGQVQLSNIGKIVRDEWYWMGFVREQVILDTFVVMPNHLHGIIIIVAENTGDAIVETRQASGKSPIQREFSSPQAQSLATIVGCFKAAVARRANQLSLTLDRPLWQRNYYEHIVRNECELDKIRNYIHHNPANWHPNDLDLPPPWS